MKESTDKPEGNANEDLPGRGSGSGAQTDADGFPIIPKNCSGCMAINAAGKARYQAAKESLRNFVDMIGNQLGMRVRDQTGLTGRYDITLSWNSGGGIDNRPDANATTDLGASMEAAVQQQLGLKLVSTKGLIDIIVVDKAERNPAQN